MQNISYSRIQFRMCFVSLFVEMGSILKAIRRSNSVVKTNNLTENNYGMFFWMPFWPLVSSADAKILLDVWRTQLDNTLERFLLRGPIELLTLTPRK